MAVPAAPVLGAVTAGDNTLSIAFTQADADPVVAGFQYQIDGKGGWAEAGIAGSPLVLTGLANGRQYSVKMRSGNADGFSPASTAATGTPVDSNAANDNGWDDASWAANPGAPVGNLDYADPDD
jgi:hypothetical protein